MDEKAKEILVLLLASVSNDEDKSVGSVIYESLAAAAVEMAKMGVELETAKEKLSIEKLSGEELAQRIKERTGLTRKEATRAIESVTLTGTGTIYIGDVFETPGGVQFRATESKSIVLTGIVKIEAVLSGSGGNVNLDPVRSTNFDLSAEWYFAPKAMLSAGLFYMDFGSIVAQGTSTGS